MTHDMASDMACKTSIGKELESSTIVNPQISQTADYL